MNHWAWPHPGTIMMFGKTLLVSGVGLLLGFGVTLSVGAGETGLDPPGLVLNPLNGSDNVGQDTSVTIGGLTAYGSSVTTMRANANLRWPTALPRLAPLPPSLPWTT